MEKTFRSIPGDASYVEQGGLWVPPEAAKFLSKPRETDDLSCLERKFAGGEDYTKRLLQAGEVQFEPHSYEESDSVERELVKYRSQPRPPIIVPFDLYERLIDEEYICPRVAKAVEAVGKLGFTETVLDPSIRYIRKTHDVDGSPNEDVGCIILFHFPVDEGGRIISKPLIDGEDQSVCAVAVDFDVSGEILSVKKYDISEGDKFDSPFNAYLAVVPPQRADELDYYYRMQVLSPWREYDGSDDKLQRRMASKAGYIQAVSKYKGISSRTDGLEVRLFKLTEPTLPQRFAVVRDNKHVVWGIYNVTEEPCPQTVIGGVPVGVFVDPRITGLPLSTRIGDVEKQIAVEERFWRGTLGKLGHFERLSMIDTAVTELAQAVGSLRDEPEAVQETDITRFVKNYASTIPYLVGLKAEIDRVPPENGIPQNLREASYAQLFGAAVGMQRRRSVLNPDYCLKNLDNFRKITGELAQEDGISKQEELQRLFGMADELLHSPDANLIINRLNLMEGRMTSQHRRMGTEIKNHVDDVVDKAEAGIKSSMRNDINRLSEGAESLTGRQQEQFSRQLAEGISSLKELWPEQAQLIAETLAKASEEPVANAKLKLTIPIIPFILQAQVEGKIPGADAAITGIRKTFKTMMDKMRGVKPEEMELKQAYE
ncbi:MAG: hypothetical protein ABH851_05050 [Methanobacteriota archaeon]